MSATKEAMVALEHAHGRKLEISIFCMDVRAFGKESIATSTAPATSTA